MFESIFFFQASLQSMALCKLNETGANLASSLLQGNCDSGNLDFLRAIIHCSPTKLDAAISLGEDLINSVLKEVNHTSKPCGIVYEICPITRNFQTTSLLHEVARRGNVKQLQRLLRKRNNCDIQKYLNGKDERQKTPLMWACRDNSVDVIKFLLSNGADLYAKDSLGQTSFLHACQKNTREVLAFLASKGARIHDIDSNGQHGIHHAARGNTRDVLELLLENLQADIHLRDWRNRFPIHHASAAGNAENVHFLIQNHSYLNSKTRSIRGSEFDELGRNYCGMTPLHYAAQNDHAHIVRMLLQYGADIDAVTDCGRSVAMLAAENGYKNIATSLLRGLKCGCESSEIPEMRSSTDKLPETSLFPENSRIMFGHKRKY